MARHKYPLPEFPSIWRQHETIYRQVFSIALRRLYETPSVSGDEDDISEGLCPLLQEACFQLKQDRHALPPPHWEKRQQPRTQDEVGQEFIAKRPDFTCDFLDPRAESSEDYSIPLHIECKLLGEPTSRTWNLNTNYVINGIARFDLESHKYGNRAPSGMMIGYIVSMTPEQIQTQVNSCIEEKLPGVPLLVFALSDVPSQSQHRFARRHVMPTPFTLIHLWVDIRSNYQGK